MRLEPHTLNGSVLIALSGGIDSVVMTHLLRFRHLGRLAVAHCNFHLRGEESDGDEAFVREFAASLGLECFVEEFDTRAFASENAVSIEMAARELRYRWFDRLCREKGFSGVCVAHNANDNAETLMLNLLRGTGLKGACCMAFEGANPYCPDTKVFRPMLGISRAEIEEYARENALKWREDSTNAINDCKRNIIRNEVFPLFEKINPSFVRTLNRDIANFRLAYEGDSTLADSLVQCGFNHSVISDLLECLQSEDPSGKVFRSSSHTAVIVDGEVLVRANEELGKASDYEVNLEQWKKGSSAKTQAGTSIVDASKLNGEPALRPWRDGDWIRPIGLKGRKLVSDILKELKIDVLARKNVMVLEGEGRHILAIIGYRVDESVKIDESTTQVYRISIK